VFTGRASPIRDGVAYGPVASPQGGYGAGFWALPDDVDPQPVSDNDPVMKVDVGFRYEIDPMPALIRGKVSLRPPCLGSISIISRGVDPVATVGRTTSGSCDSVCPAVAPVTSY